MHRKIPVADRSADSKGCVRMAKNKKNVRHRRRKRRGARIFWTLFTFLIVAGAIIASLTVFLKVSDIEVSGSSRYTPEQLIESSGIKVGDNLFGVNKFDSIEKIKSDFPYIEDVKITRRLPDTFVFQVTERIPCGYILEEDCAWVVDHKGYLLERVGKEGTITGIAVRANEPLVTPFPGGEINWATAGKKDAYLTLMAGLKEKELLGKVGTVDVSAIYALEFSYENRIFVTLGTTQDMDKKINMFNAVLPKLAPTDRGRLNVSNLGEARFVPERTVENEE